MLVTRFILKAQLSSAFGASMSMQNAASTSKVKEPQPTDLQRWVKSKKLTEKDWRDESKAMLRVLARPNCEADAAIFHSVGRKLERAGLFRESDPDLMQLFLEVFSFERLPKDMQESLYHYLVNFLETGQYSVIIKIGLCLRVLEMGAKQPCELKDPRMTSFVVSYLFKRAEFMNLSDLIRLYHFGIVQRDIDQEERNQLIEAIEEALATNSMDQLNEFHLLDFLWSISYQRYHLIAKEMETQKVMPMSELRSNDASLVKLIAPHLVKSRILKSSLAWSR